MDKYINYPQIIDDAMHDAVRQILKVVEKDGLQGEHHFFISFLTQAPNIQLSERVRKKYPNEITIVLQHQFQNLVVQDDYFTIKLSFDGISEVVKVPFQSLTSFTDPEAQFAIQFEYYPNTYDHEDHKEKAEDDTVSSDKFSNQSNNNVISLDHFRQKKKD